MQLVRSSMKSGRTTTMTKLKWIDHPSGSFSFLEGVGFVESGHGVPGADWSVFIITADPRDLQLPGTFSLREAKEVLERYIGGLDD